jgi:diacylglycerol kinase
MHFIKKNLSRLSFASSGIRHAIQTDYSFRMQVYGIGIIVTIVLFLFAPLAVTEVLFICLAYILILITELQNSAFEAALDHLHPELHHNIGRSKDMAAGAVLLAGLFLIVVIGSLLFTHYV